MITRGMGEKQRLITRGLGKARQLIKAKLIQIKSNIVQRLYMESRVEK